MTQGGSRSSTPVVPKQPSDDSVLRTSGSIALATLISRITGFVRTVLVLALLGAAIASSFQAAYVLPNMVAEVVLGAVLTAIVIPVLVRAEREDADGGAGFVNRIFTLTVVVLGAATLLALVAAPALTILNLGDGKVNRDLATALAFLLLPSVLFYGLSALFIAILNMKGLFKPGAWAPVLNNIVQITTLIAYAAAPGDISLNPVRMGDTKLLILGVGTTLGVVAQTMVLVPAIRRSGVKLRLQWGLDARLRKFGNMALAIVIYVAVLQVGLIVTYRIASSASEAGVSVYATQWQLLQLPYGVLGVTILTAIMPRLSRNAAADDTHAVVDDLSLATRLTMVSMVPIIAFMTFFGPAIGIAVFNFGKFDADTASQLGSVLSWGAFTMIPYAMTLVQLRVFYAREDAWTPTYMVIGITAVKVASSYLGPVLFDDPDAVIRWLALSNGLGYLVGAIVGHYLLRSRLGGARMDNVGRTVLWTIGASVACSALVWGLAEVSGLHRMSTEHGKLGSVAYLFLVAVVAIGLTYTVLTLLRVPDVLAVVVAVRRLLGRFIPAIAPAPEPDTDGAATMTVQFPRISADESVPYSGQVEVIRRFDRGTSSWQAYSVTSGGAAGMDVRAPADLRYRRRGVGAMTNQDADKPPAAGPAPTTAASRTGGGSDDQPTTKAKAEQPRPREGVAPAPDRPVPDLRSRRGPRLLPGAAVAGGRYRLLQHHGGARGLQFWQARDINLDRDVALTFVDAQQVAPPPEPGVRIDPRDEGPQAVLSRTLRLGRINSPGIARVLDVVRGSSGGIVVAEWVPSSSLADVAKSGPSPVGAARAVRALAAAAESAHRNGGALSIDHPERIRISQEGNAFVAFPGTLVDSDKSTDVRGLGAVLYALLLARWPLDPDTGSTLATSRKSNEPVGGLPPAAPGPDNLPREPRAERPDVPFEISAVAARALEGNSGIRTAATVQHVLDQATVLDQKTDLIAQVGPGGAPVSSTPRAKPRMLGSGGTEQKKPRSVRMIATIAGAALLTLFLVIALVVWASNSFGADDSTPDIDSIFSSSAPASGAEGAPAAAAPIPLAAVSMLDYSDQEPDSRQNLNNVISGQAPPWQTDEYRGGPRFGNLKPGLGLMFTLERDATLTEVVIRTPTPGIQVEIRTADNPQAAFETTRRVGAATLEAQETRIPITGAGPSKYVLVWLTSLPRNDNGRYQGAISQVSMTG
ncbi:murein biosynthesis integral membrane protein MurJ [Williamsia sp. 1135]|uniref:murein biosynthesis integral membrane protein MurJ n=1 Tax=Williamsia sp. 1135 TaxID=1889262 RepID=UPI000A10D0D5|nr:murein biosynthesis integral membrane protein MurJ [Williamsia sp. 1135]ORM34577.1 virulence factor MviN [Williamsia sp. 1135]